MARDMADLKALGLVGFWGLVGFRGVCYGLLGFSRV